ncbi:hypothetical protein BGZ80_008289, partial [Entomortierella chlamydospora]
MTSSVRRPLRISPLPPNPPPHNPPPHNPPHNPPPPPNPPFPLVIPQEPYFFTITEDAGA